MLSVKPFNSEVQTAKVKGTLLVGKKPVQWLSAVALLDRNRHKEWSRFGFFRFPQRESKERKDAVEERTGYQANT